MLSYCFKLNHRFVTLGMSGGTHMMDIVDYGIEVLRDSRWSQFMDCSGPLFNVVLLLRLYCKLVGPAPPVTHFVSLQLRRPKNAAAHCYCEFCFLHHFPGIAGSVLEIYAFALLPESRLTLFRS